MTCTFCMVALGLGLAGLLWWGMNEFFPRGPREGKGQHRKETR